MFEVAGAEMLSFQLGHVAVAILIIALPDLSYVRHHLLSAAIAQHLLHRVTKLKSFLPLQRCWVLFHLLYLVGDALIF